MWITLCLTILAAGATTLAQPEDCSELGFSDGMSQPFTGSDLPLCRSDMDQCCSEDYVEKVQERVQNRLEMFLREEFRDVIDDYRDEIDNLLEYFTDVFPTSLLRHLSFFSDVPENPLIRRILRNLVENLEIFDDDDFDVGDFLEDLFEAVFKFLAQSFVQDDDTAECVLRVIRSELNGGVVGRLNAQLQRIRRGISALMRIGRFLEQENNRLRGISILQRCVERFLNLSFCDRCVQKTPPLCFSTCNALVRACYSPYYTALNAQYGRLWREVTRIINVLNVTVEGIASDEVELLDPSDVIALVREECGVRMDTDRQRRHSDNKPDSRSRRLTMTTTTGSSSSTNSSGSGEEETSMSRDTSGSRSSSTTGSSTSNSTGMSMSDSTGRSRSSSTTGSSTSNSTGGSRSSSTGRSSSSSTTGSSTSNSTGGSRSSSSSMTDTTGDSVSSRIIIIDDDPIEFIPVALVDDLFELRGAFSYGDRGLHFCIDALVDDRSDGTCISPELLDRDERYCKDKEICTSRCYCTNGRNFTRDNETGDTFNMNNVEDQGDNPVFPFVAELMEEADRIAENDPVGAFLASDEFTSVDPGQLDLDGGESRASAKGLGFSLTLLLIAVTTKAFLN